MAGYFANRSCSACTCISSSRSASIAFTAAVGGFDRRDARHAGLHGGGADLAFVGAGAFAAGRVHDQRDLAVGQVSRAGSAGLR